MHDVVSPAARTGLIKDLFLNPQLERRHLSVEPDEVIYDVGHPARSVYLILRGQVRIHQIGPDGSGRLLEILGPEEWFGVETVSRAPGHATRAVAVAPSVVIAVSGEALLSSAAAHPAAALELIRQMAGKVQSAREDAARLVFDDCNLRLLKTLVRFSGTAAATPQPDGVVLHITHQQLAQAVGVARETVSLALTQLRQRNLLRTGRNQLRFNPDALRRLTERNGHNPKIVDRVA